MIHGSIVSTIKQLTFINKKISISIGDTGSDITWYWMESKFCGITHPKIFGLLHNNWDGICFPGCDSFSWIKPEMTHIFLQFVWHNTDVTLHYFIFSDENDNFIFFLCCAEKARTELCHFQLPGKEIELQLGKSFLSCSRWNILSSRWFEESFRILEILSVLRVVKGPSGLFKDHWVFIFQKNLSFVSQV